METTPVLSRTPVLRVHHLAEDVAKHIAVHADDIASNLEDIIEKGNSKTSPSVGVTPYHLILALGRSGWLNSLLEHVEPSAEVFLSALESLHYHGNMHGEFLRKDTPEYRASCIRIVDFLRAIAKDEVRETEYHEYYPQQEENLSTYTVKKLEFLANEIFCHTLAEDASHKHGTLPEAVKSLLPKNASHLKHIFPALIERRIQEHLLSRELADQIQRSGYCHTSPEQTRTIVQYLRDLVNREIGMIPINADAIIDWEVANAQLKRVQSLLYPAETQSPER